MDTLLRSVEWLDSERLAVTTRTGIEIRHLDGSPAEEMLDVDSPGQLRDAERANTMVFAAEGGVRVYRCYR